MKGQWCYWKSYFTPEYCNEIINKAKETLPVQQATVYGNNTGSGVNETARKSYVRWIRNTEPWTELFKTMETVTKRSNDDWFNLDYNELSSIQFTEYDAAYQGQFKMHQDVLWMSAEPLQRKLTFVIQLSDPNTYQGGDLTFQHLNQYPATEEIRAQGTVIFFPSLFFHQANALTEGTRYSLVGWWNGPHWR